MNLYFLGHVTKAGLAEDSYFYMLQKLCAVYETDPVLTERTDGRKSPHLLPPSNVHISKPQAIVYNQQFHLRIPQGRSRERTIEESKYPDLDFTFKINTDYNL
ncbi:hypothetical protein J6590_012811, partial [Homalodisca vitripennis]